VKFFPQIFFPQIFFPQIAQILPQIFADFNTYLICVNLRENLRNLREINLRQSAGKSAPICGKICAICGK
jgi:hypothetical protein